MKILIVSPAFAPLSTVGAARMTSLAKYLREKHEVSVLTYSLSYYNNTTAKSLQTPKVEGIEYYYFETPLNTDLLRNKNKLDAALYKYLSGIFRAQHFDVLLVSLGPLFTEAAVCRACKRYNVRYVADFRDLDILDYYFTKEQLSREMNYLELVRKRIKDQYLMYFEKKLVRNANALVVANPEHSKMLADSYGIPENKVHTILNGYDDERLDKIEWKPVREASDNRFVIGLFGKIYSYDNARTERLMLVLKDIISTHENAVIWHVGEISSKLQNFAHEIGLSDEQYVNYGILDYVEAMKILSRADMFALVIVHPHSLGTKIYDYLYFNKPVISMSPDGIAFKKFFGNLKNVCISDDNAELKDFICHIIDDKITLRDNECSAVNYARSSSNRQFEELLTKVSNID